VRRARRIAVGDRVGRYVVASRLGAGGMGVVYLAHDPDLERPVAIKIVRPGVATGRNRLLREGQAIARLSHPNVVTVFDVGVHGEDLFIAMEYVPGTTLDAWLRSGPQPAWPPRTGSAWSTATSSPTTSSSARTAACSSPTSGWSAAATRPAAMPSRPASSS
jgi:serine/threonine protein kinase